MAFTSNADNLSAADDPAVIQDVYVRDLQLQTTTLVSRQSAAEGGAGADDTSFEPAISADGRFVAFDTFADNLSTEDDDVRRDVFGRDTISQTTTLASRQSAADGGAGGDGSSTGAAISADGRLVAFESDSDNLSVEDDDAVTDVLVRDLAGAATTLVSRAAGPTGPGGDARSEGAAISADGRYVAFESEATNLSTEDGVSSDVFRRDVLGPPPAPTGGGPVVTAAVAVCRTLPPAPTPTPGDPSDIRLTTGQLLINQRIDQAAIRRANGVQAVVRRRRPGSRPLPGDAGRG